MRKKAAVITLGCAKNTVDSELIASRLRAAGVEVCVDPEDAPVALINTCGFIEPAREESIDRILDVAALKESGSLKALIVSGCMASRYSRELEVEMPEIDVLCGLDTHEAADAVLAALGSDPGPGVEAGEQRGHRFTPRGWSYLRISEGCDNRCGYCAIPLIRGPLVSRPEAETLEEAARLAGEGVKELNVIAHDTTSFGRDRGEPRLHMLLENLCREIPDVWIRLLYTHPAHYYPRLIDVLARREQICPYLDIPFQHINDGVLHAMGRKVDRAGIEELVEELRARIPSLVLRTTFLVGHPAEDDASFKELLEFVEAWRFERMGAFIYSREEGTPSAQLADNTPQEVKQQRHDRLMLAQRRIAFDHAEGRRGEVTSVLLENFFENGLRAGRSPSEAPEVDPLILLEGAEEEEDGRIVRAKITGREGYDCLAVPLQTS